MSARRHSQYSKSLISVRYVSVIDYASTLYTAPSQLSYSEIEEFGRSIDSPADRVISCAIHVRAVRPCVARSRSRSMVRPGSIDTARMVHAMAEFASLFVYTDSAGSSVYWRYPWLPIKLLIMRID